MTVGILQFTIVIRGARSLKQKRQVVRSLKDRARNEFNVSIAEVDGLDSWQRAVLGAATVSNDSRYANGVLSKLIDFVRVFGGVELVDYQIDLL